jgi:quercetin dioxygenase-like cupin family protein
MTAPFPPGLRVDVVAGNASTGGACALLEVRAPAGTAVPPHSHRAGKRTVLLLDGRVELVRGTERSVLGPGDLTRLSSGSPCRMTALTEVRLLVLAVPAGLDGPADLVRPGSVPDPDDVAALLSVAGVSLLPTA